MEPQCLPEPQRHPSTQSLACPSSPGLGSGPGREPGPSSSLPSLPRSAQTASLTRIFPEAQGALPSALDCAHTSSSWPPGLRQPGVSGP